MDPEPIPETLGGHAYILRVANPSIGMFLGVRRKPENPGETHTDTGRNST